MQNEQGALGAADLDKDAAYAALAPDLSGYSAAAKANIQQVIDAQTVVLEKAIATNDSGTIIIKSREVVAANFRMGSILLRNL